MLHLFTKIKKNTWRYHYFTPVNQKSWWCSQEQKSTAPEMWRTEIGNFWSISALLLPWKPKKSKLWKDNFLPFWVTFCPSTPENQNFEKLKKTTWDVIILHMCTINDNHTMYGSEIWSAKHLIYCHFGLFFVLLSPLTIQKIKILKKWEKDMEILSFYKCVYHKWQSYDVWFLRYGARPTEFFFCFGSFFALLYP